MNKQQLAAKIWESANQMRSKIEANEYKDYILGFIFYKYLSEKELQFAKKYDFTDEDIKGLSEEETETVEYFKKSIGYFISYDHLFSTWVDKAKDFDVSDVRDALSAFSRLISPAHKKLFDGIFDTLQSGLSKLGDTSASQTKAISQLIHLIKDIPMDGKQGYDVLGYIYEYLIEKFAANAGKKAGEFYTPHEVSVLMSEIIAYHLQEKSEIQIYDSTSGSGSLLINIGSSVAKHIDDEHNIKYYAQELKQNTYNLTRMNLVMRGIIPSNIVARRGDTLEEDWPYFDENDPVHTYNPLYVDAVVSNPPYSQKWDSEDKEADPRYSRFGLAPKAKADYAFLLHDLFHIKPDGIMAIVLPHGVLFRGGEESAIRENLIEANHIDTVIGLPPSIFFGTGIPTIIMILKQKRENTDVLIVDASKEYEKDGKNNKLRASDIKKISDTVNGRLSIPKYSKIVERQEIRDNEYNLNIPRYVDSTEAPESWDIYASMFGGIPVNELEDLNSYWESFTGLRESLFSENTEVNVDVKVSDIEAAIKKHSSVQVFVENFNKTFGNFNSFLVEELITNMKTVHINREEKILGDDIFKRLQTIPLIDKYEAYQILDDNWQKIKVDLEIIQTEGFESTKVVDPNMVIRKRKGKDTEVQEGWIGRILPFKLVQEVHFPDELNSIQEKEDRLIEIASELDEIIDSFTEEEKDLPILNDSNDKFVNKEVDKAIGEILQEVESEEITALKDYLKLLDDRAKKKEKEVYIANCSTIDWSQLDPNKDGTFGKNAVSTYLQELQLSFEFPEGTFEQKIVQTTKLINELKKLKKLIKEEEDVLHLQTKEFIEELSDELVIKLLELKWVKPLVSSINFLPDKTINHLSDKIQALVEKYEITYSDIAKEINEAESSLAKMIDTLDGNEHDIKGLKEFQSSLMGSEDE
ncbi:MAG: type I restriction-modification system subunit M [Balneola sp.]|nr:type I restriction-modification system subunit M [Balneola sp.]